VLSARSSAFPPALGGGENLAKMTKADAARIQSAADRTGTNVGFKARAQSAAAKNEGGSE
jgi:hypothetical protein